MKKKTLLTNSSSSKRKKLFSLLCKNNVSLEQLKRIIDKGLLLDLLKTDIDNIDRNEYRKNLGLPVISSKDFSPILSNFGPAITEFKITVPTDYNHDNFLDTFSKKEKELPKTHYYDKDLRDANFSKASNKLLPGKTYKVKIFPILETVSSEDCVTFLKNQKAILVGAQGLWLAQHLKKEKFPVERRMLSFDEKDSFWEDADGLHRVLSVRRYSGGDWSFRLDYFESSWDDSHCLVCFCD